MRGTDKVDDVLTSTPPPTLDRPDPSARRNNSPSFHNAFLQSICHDVLGLNYLDGMSKSAADGDTVACAAADRPEQAGKLEARTTGGAG